MAPSKLLLPLSFAALLGGTMTLIGASTNLIVLSMAAKKVPDLKMNLFELGVVGVPITVAGLLYILAFSGSLLPDRLSRQNTTINARWNISCMK
jgi:di/tricarboxylate transporter